jgi:hypothetical protein
MPDNSFISRLERSVAKRLNSLAARGIPFETVTLGEHVAFLSKGERYSFARFGDGEWSAIFGTDGANCDGHPYYPELGQRLRQCLVSPLPYLHGMQPLAMKTEGRKIVRFLREHKVAIRWSNADVFHDANKDGLLFPLVDQLRSMTVVLVGPAYLKAIGSFIPLAGHIEIPARNCFLSIDKIEEAILHDSLQSDNRVYAISASMAAKVLINDLFPKIGDRNWLIDFGSLWDVYAGVKSRGVYADRDWTAIIKKNLGQKVV